jgi:hypothetical protein
MPQSWRDFSGFLDTGANVQERPRGEHADVLGPAAVAQVLDDLRVRLDAGDRAALWAGIRAVCRFNVPAPYWLADALLQVDRDLHNTTQSAHDLLGLAATLPLSDNRGPLARRGLRLQRDLWFEVQRQRRRAPGLSTSKAVEAARKALRFPYQQRQAVAMFERQDELQQDHARPYLGRVVKRLQR